MFGYNIERKWVATVLGAAVIVGGLAFWWLQGHDFYDETKAAEHVVMIDGWEYPVTQWNGVTSKSSPLNMRACFVLQAEFDAPPAASPEPREGPGWFRCFSAETIADNLQRGYAKAYIAARNDPEGFDRIIAVFPGGRTYMWHQPTEIIRMIDGIAG